MINILPLYWPLPWPPRIENAIDALCMRINFRYAEAANVIMDAINHAPKAWLKKHDEEIFQKQGKSLDDLTKPDFESWYLVILSVIFTAILLTAFQKLSVNHNNLQNGR